MTAPATSIDNDLLDRILGEIMEAMTFCGVERVSEDEFTWDDAAVIWSRVDLKAPAEGDFWMVVPRDAMLELTDVVWAGEIEANEDAAKSLMAEIVNAVAGQVLAECPGAETVLLGLPEQGAGSLAASESPEARHAYLLDDGTPIAVLLRDAA